MGVVVNPNVLLGRPQERVLLPRPVQDRGDRPRSLLASSPILPTLICSVIGGWRGRGGGGVVLLLLLLLLLLVLLLLLLLRGRGG